VEITEVRVKLMEEPGERLQAFCSITFDDAFVVRDLKIIEGSTGPFVAMPSRKLTAHCYQCGSKNHLRAAFCNQCGSRMKEPSGAKDDDGRAKLYADIAHPINSTCREMIQQRVIQAFEEEKARSKLPGYVPTYEDFESETISPPALPRLAPTVTTQIQGAERPRGPHKIPAHKPQPQQVSSGQQHNGHAANGFGAGIFE
jgi:stage V sporulation protein G